MKIPKEKTWVKFKAETISYARAIITSCGMGLYEKNDAFFFSS